MKVIIEKDQKSKEIPFNGKVKDLLIKLNINPETVIIAKNNELVTLEDNISNNDEIKILSVISGG